MNLLLNTNTNFVELEENVLNEINGGLPWKTIGKFAWKGAKYVGGALIDIALDDATPVY